MKRSGYLFEWPSRHNVHIALPLLLIVSFFMHAVGVLLFQVTYPKSSTPSARSAQVVFLMPGSREANLIQPMLGASDPALFSPAQAFDRDRRDLPETSYIASFDASRPSLAPLPAGKTSSMASTSRYFDQKVSETLSPSRLPGPATQVTFGGDLAGRSFTPPDAGQLPLPALQGLASAEFLIAVSSEGAVQHIIPQAAPGEEAVDPEALSYALRYLARARFAPQPGDRPSWGTASFEWGADIQARPHP